MRKIVLSLSVSVMFLGYIINQRINSSSVYFAQQNNSETATSGLVNNVIESKIMNNDQVDIVDVRNKNNLSKNISISKPRIVTKITNTVPVAKIVEFQNNNKNPTQPTIQTQTISSPPPTPVQVANTPKPAVVQTSSTPSLGQYRDGQYTGALTDAFYGNIQVQAVVTKGQLTDVVFLDYPQDRSNSIKINTRAMPILKSEALQVQSANVDIVSGATATSEAFQQSLGSALAQAL
jgi:uncharacterized protein with FMN-binding domain